MKVEYISKRVKAIREKKKLTQSQFAKHLGISAKKLDGIEKGKSVPDQKTIDLLIKKKLLTGDLYSAQVLEAALTLSNLPANLQNFISKSIMSFADNLNNPSTKTKVAIHVTVGKNKGFIKC